MIIYIAGPIMAPGPDGGLPTTKDVAARKLKFYEVYNVIRGLVGPNTVVCNPLDIAACRPGRTLPMCSSSIEGGVDHSWQCYLRYDLEKLVMCDEIVMLPGWEGSPGASVEHKVATMLGLEINYWCDVHHAAHPDHGFNISCEGVQVVNRIHP